MIRDILSDVLKTIRLRGAVFFYVGGSGRWAAEAPPARDIAPAVMPGAERVIEYHVVTAGQCWAAIVGEPPLRLAAGDVVVFTQGDPHVLSSHPGMRADRNIAWYHQMNINERPFSVAFTGTGPPSPASSGRQAETTLVCGFLGCDARPFHPLLASLPRMLHLRQSEASAWITRFLEQAVRESASPSPGGEALLARISELIFVDAVRRFADSLPPGSTGWLAGLRDRHVARALGVLHQRPERPWTMEDLALHAGLSRSALHERFRELLGQAPMQYLGAWRMQVAARLLRESDIPVAAVAAEVGYESEASFSRAFKRLVGAPPALWRRGAATAGAELARAQAAAGV